MRRALRWTEGDIHLNFPSPNYYSELQAQSSREHMSSE